LWGCLEDDVNSLLSRTRGYFSAKLEISCGNGQRQRVKTCSRGYRAAHCRVLVNGRRSPRIHTVTTGCPWSYYLINCAIL
jgi:hypothetical protein